MMEHAADTSERRQEQGLSRAKEVERRQEQGLTHLTKTASWPWAASERGQEQGPNRAVAAQRNSEQCLKCALKGCSSEDENSNQVSGPSFRRLRDDGLRTGRRTMGRIPWEGQAGFSSSRRWRQSWAPRRSAATTAGNMLLEAAQRSMAGLEAWLGMRWQAPRGVPREEGRSQWLRRRPARGSEDGELFLRVNAMELLELRGGALRGVRPARRQWPWMFLPGAARRRLGRPTLASHPLHGEGLGRRGYGQRPTHCREEMLAT
jgi:hypothetical protein